MDLLEDLKEKAEGDRRFIVGANGRRQAARLVAFGKQFLTATATNLRNKQHKTLKMDSPKGDYTGRGGLIISNSTKTIPWKWIPRRAP